MTLTLKETNDLQHLIEYEVAAYVRRLNGYHIDYPAVLTTSYYPSKTQLGAIERIVESSLIGAMNVLQGYLDRGYTLHTNILRPPEIVGQGCIIYVEKPEAVQAEDIKKIVEQITAEHEASVVTQ